MNGLRTALAAPCVAGSNRAIAEPAHTAIDSGSLGGPQSDGRAIDSNGDGTGNSSVPVPGDTSAPAFRYSGDAMTSLGTLGAPMADAAVTINDSGRRGAPRLGHQLGAP